MSIKQDLEREKLLDDLFGDAFDDLLVDPEDLHDNFLWENNTPPVSIIEFINSDEFLGLKGRIYPYIQKAAEEIERENILEAILLLGKGSGKTTFMQIYLAYGAYFVLSLKNPQEYYGLLPGSPIAILLVSVSEKQAKEVGFAGVKAMIDRSPWFKGKFTALSAELRFPKNLTLYCGHSGASSWLGFNTVRAAMDETEFMTDSNNRSVARELFRALKGSLTTRFPGKYKLLCVSSPKNEFSFLNSRFKDIKNAGTAVDLSKVGIPGGENNA